MKPQSGCLFILLASTVFCADIEKAVEDRTTKILPKYFSEICGETFTDRIISGKNASLGQFPWMARIDIEGYGFDCGGALISDRHVISAAHCLTGKVLGVLLGELNINTDPDCEDDLCADKAQYIKSASYSIPDGYDTPTFAHDILLIKLAQPAKLNEFVIPICLPTGNELNPLSKDAKEIAEIAGWGYINHKTLTKPGILQYAKVAIRPMEECAKGLARAILDKKRQICAGGGSNEGFNRDSCSGDSGGPLMQVLVGDNGPRYFMTGIVSFGRATCGDTSPAIYTRVTTYLNFISKKIKNDF